MSKDNLFEAFKSLFPEWGVMTTSYKKIGSKCLAIKFAQHGSDNEISRVFLYDNPNNWQFGTKLWRKRPDKAEKK